jgi:hypothetical protein
MIRDLGGGAAGAVVYVEHWLDELNTKARR